ncbi:MAG: PD40 domain-containing protein [Sedimentisphaerales bacterium]|nr:PD40 domain-containing protein [Sedimentisphaerales bacterium]
MRKILGNGVQVLCLGIPLFLWPCTLAFGEAAAESAPPVETQLPQQPCDRSEIDLEAIPFKIVHETYRETEGKENWELYIVNADGTHSTNLTQTPEVDEMYPHVSSDGTKICFVADETGEDGKVRNVYYMNVDGTGRVKVADNARQPCWSPDGKVIAYVKGEYDRYSARAFASKELLFYDVETASHRTHPNRDLHHLYNVCWSPNGRWLVATVTGGMGFDHSIIAFEAEGDGVFDLHKYGIDGCRPDLSSDGKKIAWGKTDWDLYVADIDLALAVPRVGDIRCAVKCANEYYVTHSELSPDGRYLAFGYGPAVNYSVGVKAPGWNICVGDLTGKWVQVTTDGKHNKEPDWVPIRKSSQ